MSTIANLTGQMASTATRTNGERAGEQAGARRDAAATRPQATAAPARDSVQLSAGAASEVTADQASQNIKDRSGQAAMAHQQVPQDLLALLDELDELGV